MADRVGLRVPENAESLGVSESVVQQQDVGEVINGSATPAEPMTASGLLDQAGLTRDLESAEDASDCLRRLANIVAKTNAGTDALVRATLREEAIVRLRGAGISSPAKMFDSAITDSCTRFDRKRVQSGGELLLADPEPWDDPVDGAGLLNNLTEEISRYVVLPKGAASAIALWVVFAHAHDQTAVSPLLTLSSPVKRCGKTTLMEILANLVPRALPASNISAAALFRAVDAYHPTLLVDEADTFIGQREELRGILNSGHTRALARVVRCDGENHEPRTFSTWCPKIVALIGALPDTLSDRSITISMRRRGPGEPTERLRLDRLDMEELRRKSARWAEDHSEELRSSDVDVPDSLSDRGADNWRPLLAIADCAGFDWPDRARQAAMTLSGGLDEEGSSATILLEDLKQVFDCQGKDRLGSGDIVAALVAKEERPWPEWLRGRPLTASGLARILKPFGIKPKLSRICGVLTRGYARGDMKDAWARYLPAADTTPASSLSRNL